jgi:xylulokinase
MAASLHFGFSPGDFRPEVLCRAVVEGHVLNLFEAFSRLPVSVEEIRVTGGLSRSAAWLQCLADVFQAETVPVRGEGAALGAAVHAAWVWCREEGRDEDLESLTRRLVALEEEARSRPDPDAAQSIETLKRLYRSLSARIRGVEGEDPFRLRSQLLRES